MKQVRDFADGLQALQDFYDDMKSDRDAFDRELGEKDAEIAQLGQDLREANDRIIVLERELAAALLK